MNGNRYEIIEGSLIRAKFAEDTIEIENNFTLFVDSINISVKDYFNNCWNNYNYIKPTDDNYYNFILHYNKSISDYDIYSINIDNYNWKIPNILEEDDWKGYMHVDGNNVLSIVYSDIYNIIKKLSPFNTIRGNRLLLIDLIKIIDSEKDEYFINNSLFKDYKILYIKTREKYELLQEKSKKFLELIKDKNEKEIKNIFKKNVYSGTYFRMLYIHKISEENIKQYLNKHENLDALLK